MLRLEAEVCNFSRNKLYRRHFPRKVLKADTAFLFALLQSFWKTPLKCLLWSSFSKDYRKHSITYAEMNFFVQTFSLKRTEGRHNFFIYFVSKLLE